MAALSLSIVVICHNMRREAPRTLHTLSRRYQRGIDDLQYEVLVIDNGSTEALDAAQVEAYGREFRYFFHSTDSVSPVEAVNSGVSMSRGDLVAICIDGARILSPGILRSICLGARLSPRPVIATLAWHLGEKPQRVAMLEGYDQGVEDLLLESIDWRGDGYELFRISCLGGSSSRGWFQPIAESSCLAMPRVMYAELGGYDPGFVSPGGGFANLDFYKRACGLPDSDLIVLLGEGTFHQFHGGAVTGNNDLLDPLRRFGDEYRSLRGADYVVPDKRAVFLGSLSEQAMAFLKNPMARA